MISDIEALYNTSIEKEAIPCYASINLRSTNENHAKDSIILADDKVQFMINTIQELKLNENETDPSKKYLSREIFE